jgi:RNA polymerase sigma-70 factor (ECF subfamily)
MADLIINSISELRGDLFAYAFSITRSREDAEDAVHNAIIKAYESIGKLRNRDKLKPWLFKILRNESLAIVRRGSRFTELPEDLPAEIKDEETRLDLGAAVGSLESELREAVVLYYKLGYSTGEIAEITKVPRGTVMSRLSRARELIKKHLEGGVKQ